MTKPNNEELANELDAVNKHIDDLTKQRRAGEMSAARYSEAEARAYEQKVTVLRAIEVSDPRWNPGLVQDGIDKSQQMADVYRKQAETSRRNSGDGPL